MAKVKVSPFWCDGELREWFVGYARERGVSQGSLLEAALRELQASAMGGVPDLGVDPDLQEAPFVRHGATPKPKPVRVDTVPAARSWAWERQQRLNRAKGL